MKRSLVKILYFIIGLKLPIYLLAYPSFEEAMGPSYSEKEWRTSSRFKTIYEKFCEKMDSSKSQEIPKIIHQIWLGGEVPKHFHRWMKTIQDKHPDWTYYLWTDQEIQKVEHLCKNPLHIMQNLGGKSDILRYAILYEYGGIYVDIDFECMQSFDPLTVHRFFAGIEGKDQIGNAIIGAAAGHPLFKKILDYLNAASYEVLNDPWWHTGPKFFTFHIYQHLKKHPEDGVIYPLLFFYPLENTKRFQYREISSPKPTPLELLKPYTFGIHYWAESWRETYYQDEN